MKTGEGVNEYGKKISLHTCDMCGKLYTIIPAIDNEEGWKSCQAENCPSYDAKRDADILFMTKDELQRKKIVSFKMLKAKFVRNKLK